jgi:hypothetical protein
MKLDINQYDPDKLIENTLPQLKYELHRIIGNGESPANNLYALQKLRQMCIRYNSSLTANYDKFIEESQRNAESIAEKKAAMAVRENATVILNKELMIAVSKNREFEHPVFLSRLQQAVNDPRTIQVGLVAGQIRIKIDMKATAGELRDWVQAVKTTRRQGNFPRSPEPLRSHIWREKYYGTAREGRIITRLSKKTGKKVDKTAKYTQAYWDTIYTRLDNCSSLAPFWYILNYGSATSTEAGEEKEGGLPYPWNTPTHFVERTIRFLQSFYQQQYSKYYTKVESDIAIIRQKYMKRFDQWDNLITAIDRKIAIEERKLTSPNKSVNPLANEVSLIEQRLGDERFSKADKLKIADLARRLERGEQIAERVSLGGVRTRTIRLIQEYKRMYGE